MLGVMSPTLTAVCYVLACVFFLVAAAIAFSNEANGLRSGAFWICAGLFAFVLVFAVNAVAAA